MPDNELVFERPDDPYTTAVWTDKDGIHIVVSADILADGDPTEARAETQRRVEFLRESMLHQFLRPTVQDERSDPS